MKHHITLLISALTMMVLTACHQMPFNGDLDGQWQIMSIEHHTYDASGEPVTETFYPEAKYICTNLGVVNLTPPAVPEWGMTGKLDYDAKARTIVFDFPFNPVSNETGEVLGDKYRIPWGIYSNPATFRIECLTSKRLVITNDLSTITCRKF